MEEVPLLKTLNAKYAGREWKDAVSQAVRDMRQDLKQVM